MIKSRRMRWAGNEVCMEMVNACRVSVAKPEESLGKLKCRREDDIKMDLWGGMGWINVAQDRGHWRALVNTAMKLQIPQNVGEFE
jgi:hypothetical protein